MEKVPTEVQIVITIKELESIFKCLQFLDECTFKEVEGRGVMKTAVGHMMLVESFAKRARKNFEPLNLGEAKSVETQPEKKEPEDTPKKQKQAKNKKKAKK
jgi:hypothetical protein